jgi:hypothetical protein
MKWPSLSVPMSVLLLGLLLGLLLVLLLVCLVRVRMHARCSRSVCLFELLLNPSYLLFSGIRSFAQEAEQVEFEPPKLSSPNLPQKSIPDACRHPLVEKYIADLNSGRATFESIVPHERSVRPSVRDGK